MSNHKNLVFFNKEGDYLNFNYNTNSDRFEGDLLFHEGSSDTYKTAGVYMLESIPSFNYEVPGELSLMKFQLFNDHGLHFYGANSFTQSITKIEPINNDSNFYSKWIYGINFESKFPIGSIIKFDSPYLEFTDVNRTYCVVGSKKNAIMIISEIDNASFESLYYTYYTDVATYVNKNISGSNLVGVYNYIDNSYNNNLSIWSEPDFYDKYYIGKKLNIIGSEKNDGIVTVNNIEVTDQVHFEYFTTPSSLPVGSDLIIEVITRTDLPKVYESGITITADSKIIFDTVYLFPRILKPGVEFKVTGSVLNDIFLTVSDVTVFESVNLTKFYASGDQVYYNNSLYQCIQAYTHSHSSDETKYITPLNTKYWSRPDYVNVDQVTTSEILSMAQVYLTTDRFYFGYGYTYSQSVTLASAAEKYKSDLLAFNIDLFYLNSKLKADLKYPSKYAEVNFYHTDKGPTYSIGSYFQTNERLVQVKENIQYELNYDYSSNFKYNIVFTDIDEYGIKIILNKQVYEEEISYIYTGLILDMSRTIDRTLRNWLARNFISLYVLGIEAELSFIGSIYSPFYNSIKLKTTYPNVPLNVDNVLVGSTADYYIEHSRVMFYDLGPYLNLKINGDEYGVSTVYGTSSLPDISTTLSNWINQHAEILLEYKIIVTNFNNLLKFDIKEMDRRLYYEISTGKLKMPGINDYVITDKLPGNLGMLISSNQITLTGEGDASFEKDGFATGMVVTVNNTVYPYNNQQYNIQFLDPTVIDLSYEGPFWSIGGAICNSSAFVTLAFNSGFGQTGCGPIIGPTGGTAGGPFDPTMFNLSMFSLSYNANVYTLNTYNLNAYPGVTGLVDIIYIQLSNSIYGFGDNLVVLDSYNGDYISTVNLPGNTQSIEIEFNTINNYLYCLSEQQISIVDPLLNTLVTTISLTYSNISAQAFDMLVNPFNGDVYVTYKNWARVDIFAYNNLTSIPSVSLSTSSTNFPSFATRTGKMVYNEFELDIYITTDVNLVLRVNGGGVSNGTNRTIQTTFGIPGLTHSIFYEPVNESVYVYGSSSLWKIDNGITQSITSVYSYSFNDIIYNNLTGEMNVSDSSNNFSRLNLDSDSVNQTSVSNYGYIELNQFDGDVYLSSQSLNNIVVVRPTDGTVVKTLPMSAQTTRLVYNPDRKSIWTLQPTLNSIIEVQVQLNSSINILPVTYSQYEENQYGTLDPNYVPSQNLWLKSDEYLRRPRENFEGEVSVKYYYKWFSDNIPNFFLYDISGDQLSMITGSYAYTGPKPLINSALNRLPNRELEKVGDSEYQQTIFDTMEYTLSYIDDEDDVTTEVSPIELFIGYRSEDEGAYRSILQLYKKEDVEVSFTASATTYIKFETLDVQNATGDKKGILTLVSDTETFTGIGLKVGQWIVIYNKDITNTTNQYISDNNGIFVKIREIYTKYIIIDFFIITTDFITTENSRVVDYPKSGNTTYLKTTIKVVDREVGRFFTYGQTEIEDPRFKIELSNVGKLIAPNEVFIFKDYDIFEGATDWIFLNAKRKEMLMMKNLIFPYIGAYKSLINAINYFGYNDLQLNEYYRDIDTNSERFGKLFKVEIPDIFDNTVEGWIETDFVKGFSTDNYEVTNLFNLTYFITDKDGNNTLQYSLDEIIVKLQGLKYWLKRNIIPITHKILDITGRAYNRGSNYINHRVQEIRSINMSDNMTPITFNMNEAYLMPINSGSTVYNCVIDFYSIVPLPMTQSLYNILDSRDQLYNSPYGNSQVPKPYNGQIVDYPDYFNLKIRTYKTYPEWSPFTVYDLGDRVTYYNVIYQSATSSNKLKDPRKYDNTQSFNSTTTYAVTEIVTYNNEVYVYSGLGATYSGVAPTPLADGGNWLKITEWTKLNLHPVQYITEYRRGNDLRPFNFTIDSNIDPFLSIELSTDNGYGCAYTQKKNYEIRGLKDITQPLNPIDPIGPFSPISPVY